MNAACPTLPEHTMVTALMTLPRETSTPRPSAVAGDEQEGSL
jgi:hypothetical protein